MTFSARLNNFCLCGRRRGGGGGSNDSVLVIKQYLAAFHGVWQALQFPVGDRHVVLAHGAVLEAPAFAVVVDELCGFAWEEEGFLVVLLAEGADEQGIRCPVAHKQIGLCGL